MTGGGGAADGKQAKLLGLEIARVTCAMAVLFWHYSHFYQAAGAREAGFARSGQPLYALFAPFYEYGLMGVYVFWAISGFIFFWRYGAAIAEGAVTAERFFWLRVSRLYPLHLVTLLAVAMLQPIYTALTGAPFVYADNSVPQFLAQLVMATHWGGPAPFSFNGPSWSISAEIGVYAAFFLLMRRYGPTNWLIGAVIVLSLGALLNGIDWPVLACAGFFFAGGAAAKWFMAAQDTNGPVHRKIAAVTLTFALGVAAGGGWLTDRGLLPFVMMIVGVPALFLAAQDWRGLHRFAAPLQRTGNLTYAAYMIHFPLQLCTAIVAAAEGVALPVANPLFLISYVATTMALAAVVHQHFERPMQAWIRTATLRSRTPALG